MRGRSFLTADGDAAKTGERTGTDAFSALRCGGVAPSDCGDLVVVSSVGGCGGKFRKSVEGRRVNARILTKILC